MPHKIISALNDILNGGSLMPALQEKQNVTILIGAQAMHHTQAAEIRMLAKKLAEKIGAKVALITDGANGAGGWLAGAVPHRHSGGSLMTNKGMNAYEMLAKPRDAYLLLNVEPEFDCANSAHAIQAMKQAAFVVSLSVYANPVLSEHADVIFPITPFTETSGTYVNMFGHWQSFHGMATPVGESRPAWKVLRVLANFLELDGFTYESSEHIKNELREDVEKSRIEIEQVDIKASRSEEGGLSRIGEIPIYAVDSITRRAEPLQTAQVAMEGNVAVLKINPVTAAKLHLADNMHAIVKQNGVEVVLPVVVDIGIAPDAVWIASGIAETQALGDLFGQVTIVRHQ